MSRVNPFDSLTDAPAFEPKPKASKPVEAEKIDQLARDNNFPSRQSPAKARVARVRRRYTTGRNQQLNFKATAATIDRFYQLAEQKKLPLCELLEKALDALEKEKPQSGSS
jgi:hypothetical protein